MSTQITQYNLYQQLTSVRAARTTNLAGSYLNGPLNNGVGATLIASGVGALVVDGVTLVANDRVLLAAQTNANENGIYIVTNAGGLAASWILTRSADFQNIEQMKAGQFLTVNAGTVNGGHEYVLVEPLPAQLGIDALVFLASSNGAQLSSSLKAIKSNFAGGAATAVISNAAFTANSVVVASIQSSANAVDIQKVTPAAGNVTVLFSADPGASVISLIAFAAGQ